MTTTSVIARDEAQPFTATIASGQAKSTIIPIGYASAYAVVMPAAFTGTSITFEVSHHPTDAATFVPLYDDSGALVTVPVAAGRGITLPNALFPWGNFRIVSDSTQGATRTLIIMSKG